jgi:hypothetical protein
MNSPTRSGFLRHGLTIALAALLAYACGGGGGGSVSPQLPGRTFGGAGNDFVWSVEPTSDGGYVLAGFSDSAGAGGYDAWVVKIDSAGVVVGEKRFGTAGNDFAFSVRQTADGGFILAGVDNAIGGASPTSGIWLPLDSSGELTLRKLNGDLTPAWETRIGGVGSGGSSYSYSMGYAVSQTSDNGYVVAGATGTGGGGGGTLLLKTDAGGAFQWNEFLDGEIGTGVRQAPDGGYVVSTAGTGALLLIKTGSAGTVEWSTPLLGSAQAVWNAADGGFVAAGDNSANAGDFHLAKTTSTGAVLWERSFGSPGGDIAYSVQQTADLGYILAGAGSGAGNNHIFDFALVKTDSVGSVSWERFFGGLGNEVARSVRQTSDGGYIVAGTTTSAGAGGIDAYVVRTDSAGASRW